MIILGLNAFHGDSAACLVMDGQLVAAAEEERFRRLKHWAGFPSESIRYCLRAGGVSIGQIDHIAINRDPGAHLMKKVGYAFSRRPSFKAIRDRLANAAKVSDVVQELAASFPADPASITARLHNVEHHKAHLASAFFVSPFDAAAVVSVDGFGDFVSTMWGTGEGNQISTRDQVNFPHSLGLFYLAFTQYLGFGHYGDEYKVMGLAPYGEATEMDKMRRVVKLGKAGRFELDCDFFVHHSEGVNMVWENGAPTLGRVFSDRLVDLFGPARGEGEELSPRHWNIAASLQAMYEEAFFHLLDHVHAETGQPNLSLAGGCAMNSVANGKIFQRSRFRDVYIQAAAGDAGGAIGAAFQVWHQELGQPRSFCMDHAFWGPEFDPDYLDALLENHQDRLAQEICRIEKIDEVGQLCRRAAAAVAAGKVMGWFQGRMEWGPRALGNRSIICDPRRADMKAILNQKIKRRESFRPFAPVILREETGQWFETDYDVPFMLQVFQIREETRPVIPAVTHVNGSGRLQTITAAQNPRYHRLIQEFGRLTGVPVLLNTSFNENEPVVCRPEEALDCFLRTRMDVLVLGDWLIERQPE